MSERDNGVRRRLEQLGDSPVPPPDRAFAARLERRLRAGSAGADFEAGPAEVVPLAPRTGRRMALGLAAAALVLVALAAAAIGFRGQSGDLSIVDRSPDPTPPAITDPAHPDDGGDEPVSERTTTTIAERDAPPATDRVPRTTTTTTPSRGGDERGTIRLSAAERDGVVLLRWSRVDHPEFAAYLVLRADAPDEPGYPPDEGTERVAVVRDRTATQLRDGPDSPTRPVYRIVAVDRAGRELARSPAVSPVESDSTTTDRR